MVETKVNYSQPPAIISGYKELVTEWRGKYRFSRSKLQLSPQLAYENTNRAMSISLEGMAEELDGLNKESMRSRGR